MDKITVYRIQDNQGRGPFKPGIPEKWIDETRTTFPGEDLNYASIIARRAPDDLHLGFGCKTQDELKTWVSQSEYIRLQKLGYRAVSIDVDRIWEMKNELIFGRRRAFRKGYKPLNLY
jgi:hypothetical protein